MLSLYPAIFYREKNNSVSVIFPDLNHLATCGEDINEAMEMATDCLAGYIYSAQQDDEILPEPTPIEKVDIHCEDDEDDDYESAFVNIVAVDVEDYAAKHFEKAVKKTLVVPVWLNQTATDLNINFSAVLKNRLLDICSETPDEKPPAQKKYQGALSALLSSTMPVPMVACAAPNPLFAKIFNFSKTPDAEKNVKKTLTLPKWLNERAMAMNVNFSAALKEALLEACKNKLENKDN